MDEERETITTGLQNLCPQVPNYLVFKHDEDDIDESLIEFFSSVDKTVTQRGHLNLVKFILQTDYHTKFKSQVNNLIHYAISCNVQRFWLLLTHVDEDENEDEDQYLYEINSESFFVNSCFTHLYVDECKLNPTGTISWINLKSLCIEFGKLDEGLIQNILSGSPLLETLVIDNCNGFRRIDITSNSVKNLVISGSMHLDDELEDVGNIITINAPHVLSLKVNGEFCFKLMLLNVSSLVEAYLDYTMDVPNKEQEEEDMLKRFILSLGHVKELKIGKDCLKRLSRLDAKGFTVSSNITRPQVPNLVFKHDEDDKDVSLIKFFSYVDKTITQRGHLHLVKFILDTDYSIKFKSQVNNLIRYAISCNVQQFWLLLSHTDEDEELDDLFKINSESFFVNSCFTHLYVQECMFNPSGTISWINLRSLCITFGKFDEVLIQNILSGSPLLETLVIDCCYGFRRIDITSNSVKNLAFSGYIHMVDKLEDVGNIITINVPHILSLKINGDLGCELMLLNVSSLVRAYLDYTLIVPNKEEEEDMLKRFILTLHHIKELRIGKHCLKALSGLEAKGFTVPSNMKYPDSDSTKSEDWYHGSLDYARCGNYDK